MELKRGLRRLKWAMALVAVAATSGTAASQSAEVSESLTADLIVSQIYVAADGQRLPGSAPAARYRLDHRAGAAGPSATISLVEIERVTADGVTGAIRLDNPFLPVRMELDSKNGLRLYNRRGERLREPTGADRQLFGLAPPASGSNPPDSRPMAGRGRAANLLIAASRSKERRAEFERIYGAPVERTRGLDRYVARRGNDVDEAFVDPVTALPAELNTMRSGALVSHVQMVYEPKGDTLIRRRLRAERALPDAARRVVTTVEVTNVETVTGGAR